MSKRLILTAMLAALLGFGGGWLARGEDPGETPSPESTLHASDGEVVEGVGAAPSALRATAAVEDPKVSEELPRAAPPGLGPESGSDIDRAARVFRARYREVSKGRPLPEGAFRRYRAQLARNLPGWARGAAQDLWERVSLREIEGDLSDAKPIHLQVRTRGNTTVKLAYAKPPSRPTRSAEPLDFDDTSKDEKGEQMIYVSSGLAPDGKRYVIDRVRIRARWLGSARMKAKGKVELSGLPGFSRRELRGGRWLAATYEGRAFMDTGREDSTGITVTNAVLDLHIEGHLEPYPVVGPYQHPKGMHLTNFEGEGFLTGGDVLIQVQNNGGSRDEVGLHGPDPRRREPSVPEDLWRTVVPPKNPRFTKVHVENAGDLPPGKAFEITSLRWRAHAYDDRGDTHAFLIYMRGARGANPPIYVNTRKDRSPSGQWSGSHVVHPGRGRSFYVEARSRGVIEVRIQGRLIRTSR